MLFCSLYVMKGVEELIDHLEELQLRNENTKIVQDLSESISKLSIGKKRRAPAENIADLSEAFSQRLNLDHASKIEEEEISKMISKLVLRSQVPERTETDLSKLLTKLTLKNQKRMKTNHHKSFVMPIAPPPLPVSLPSAPIAPTPVPTPMQTQTQTQPTKFTMALRKRSPILHMIDMKKVQGLSQRSSDLIKNLANLLNIYKKLKKQKEYKGSILSLIHNTHAIAKSKKSLLKRLLRENENIASAWEYIFEMDAASKQLGTNLDDLKLFVENDRLGIYSKFERKIAFESYVNANNLIVNNKNVLRRIFEDLLPIVPRIAQIKSNLAS